MLHSKLQCIEQICVRENKVSVFILNILYSTGVVQKMTNFSLHYDPPIQVSLSAGSIIIYDDINEGIHDNSKVDFLHFLVFHHSPSSHVGTNFRLKHSMMWWQKMLQVLLILNASSLHEAMISQLVRAGEYSNYFIPCLQNTGGRLLLTALLANT